MLLVVGVWTFLRAVLVGAAAIALNFALRHLRIPGKVNTQIGPS
jgi:hypothetical protein